MSDLIEAEHAEPGDEGAAARALLADPATPVVAVRTDGQAAITTGLPAGVDPDTLDAPVAAGGAVAVVLDMASDTETIVAFGRFRDPRMALVEVAEPRRVLGALGFAQWRARTRFCPRDGGRLVARADGRTQRCQRCQREHFPRLEPAVIMRVTDAEDRILLGRQPGWPEGRYSVLAGFVDPGESIEDAVVREIAEEVGVPVTDVAYAASQPWPFPASLMLGFTARATDTTLVLEDEIAEAHWFTRDGLVAAMDEGRAFLPPDVSIAHRLIMSWLGEVDIATWYDQR